MAKYVPYCSVEVKFGTKEDLRAIVNDCGPDKKVLVVCEKFCTDMWELTADIEKNCAEGNEFWMSQITPNPTQLDVYNGLKLIEGCDPDFILAIGGGSAIDTAKGVSNFHYLFKGKEITVEAITEMLRSGSYKAEHDVIDIISVPSAAGTGSEVTQFATIWDVNKTAKFSIDTPQNYPKMSLVIPELTLTLPQKLTFSTGVDALSHAVEAYWAKPTTFVVKDIALKAIDTIMTYLPKVLDDPKNLELRNYQSRGALLAGMAFARTRTTACHSISYAMTMQYGVPHGIACCMTLDPVSKINRPVIVCADDLFATFEKHGGLQKWLDENAAKAGVSLKLKDWGVDEAGIDHLVTQTFTKGRMDNNPVDIAPEKVKEILQGIYE